MKQTTVYPCAKINLGLNIVARRADGYHDLQTVFLPVPLTDTLSVEVVDDDDPSASTCELSIEGVEIQGDLQDNLVVRAYDRLAKQYPLPRVRVRLTKRIPTQAGMGGGSSDAAFMLRAMNRLCDLNIGNAEMETIAAELGADCAFFVRAIPAYAEGIGDRLSPLPSLSGKLRGLHLVVVKPPVAVSTREAFALVRPQTPVYNCREIVSDEPLRAWRDLLINDFEASVFPQLPELAAIKRRLYALGALFAAMSGSGSSLFALFANPPKGIVRQFPETIVFESAL